MPNKARPSRRADDQLDQLGRRHVAPTTDAEAGEDKLGMRRLEAKPGMGGPRGTAGARFDPGAPSIIAGDNAHHRARQGGQIGFDEGRARLGDARQR